MYLASGNSIRKLAFHYRIRESTVAKAIKDTCAAINRRMMDTHLARPTEQEWRNIASKFSTRWNFPNCIGAIGGKHILLFAPPHSGSLYFNYKKLWKQNNDNSFLNIKHAEFHKSKKRCIAINSACILMPFISMACIFRS